jgi:hypothetical protein
MTVQQEISELNNDLDNKFLTKAKPKQRWQVERDKEVLLWISQIVERARQGDLFEEDEDVPKSSQSNT